MTRRQNTGWLLGMGVALLLDLAIVLAVPMSSGMAIVLGLVLGFTCSVAGIALANR